MKKKAALRITRIIVSSVMLLGLFLLFLNMDEISPNLAIFFTSVQFVPSVLRFGTLLLGAFTLGFLLIAGLTLLFGKFYCSFLCPLGKVMDFFNFSGHKLRKTKFRNEPSLPILRYVILGVVVGTTAFGFLAVLNIFEPYSVFGRLVTHLLKPPIVMVNNLLSNLLGGFDIYVLHLHSLHDITLGVLIFTLLFTTALLALSFFKGRFYCNNLCPVGTLLGLFSRFSLFKIKIATECTACGLCQRSCLTDCIDSKNKTVDYSRCVLCFNCVASCSQGAVTYGIPQATSPSPDAARRKLLGAMLGSVTSLFAVSAMGRALQKTLELPSHSEIMPPGASDVAHFTAHCTGCHLCASVCPDNIIKPLFFAAHDGHFSFLSPRLDYALGFCQFECKRCIEVCPTGALKPLTLPEKKRAQIGISHFIRERCIVVVKNTDCGACSEHCPTKAVDMVDYINGLVIPEVTPSLCIGCGACEHACPVNPKAILVEGNAIHRVAEPPRIEQAEPTHDIEGDFPF